jgi:hypothetical protein
VPLAAAAAAKDLLEAERHQQPDLREAGLAAAKDLPEAGLAAAMGLREADREAWVDLGTDLPRAERRWVPSDLAAYFLLAGLAVVGTRV